MSAPKSIRLLGPFVIDILAAVLLFLVIAIVAYGLQLFIALLEANKASQFLVKSLTAIEYLLFIGDAVLFVLYFVRSSIDLARKILNQE